MGAQNQGSTTLQRQKVRRKGTRIEEHALREIGNEPTDLRVSPLRSVAASHPSSRRSREGAADVLPEPRALLYLALRCIMLLGILRFDSGQRRDG
jgi:hypothetical protein